MNTLSVRKVIGSGIATFKTRPWFLIAIIVLCMSIGQIAAMPMQFAIYVVGGLGLLILPKAVAITLLLLIVLVFFVAIIAISVLTQIGQTNLFLKAERNIDAVVMEDLWAPAQFWNYIGVTLLATAGIILGFILLIIPGIILAIGWMFAPFIVIDKGYGPVASLKESWRITRGHRWKLFLLAIVIGLMNLAGVLVFFVGILVTAPITLLTLSHVYRMLSQTEAAVQVPQA